MILAVMVTAAAVEVDGAADAAAGVGGADAALVAAAGLCARATERSPEADPGLVGRAAMVGTGAAAQVAAQVEATVETTAEATRAAPDAVAAGDAAAARGAGRAAAVGEAALVAAAAPVVADVCAALRGRGTECS